MKEMISKFFSKEWESIINEKMLNYDFVLPVDEVHQYASDICSIPMNVITDYAINDFPKKPLCKTDFLQFSDPNDATINLCTQFKKMNGNGLSAYELGKVLLPEGKKHEAYRKYGEGNGKAGTALGLLSCFSNTYFLSAIGDLLPNLGDSEQDKLISRLIIRTPEFSTLLFELSNNNTVNLREFMSLLTDSTYVRRRSTFRNLYRMLVKNDESFFESYFNNLIIP